MLSANMYIKPINIWVNVTIIYDEDANTVIYINGEKTHNDFQIMEALIASKVNPDD